MARSLRHNKIIDLISKNDIETQEELSDRLNEAGFKVTQATVSRDIKELGLIKVMTEDKKYKYSYVNNSDSNVSGKLYILFKQSIIAINKSLNIIVLKTLSGSANSAASFIDKLNIPEILGCVAGDDTIIIIVKKIEDTDSVVKRLEDLLK
jgi:transcriptional regulator of arginine metabolism